MNKTIKSIIALGAFAPLAAFAEGGAASAGAQGDAYWAAAIVAAVAAAVGTFSQSRAAVAALEGTARNPGAAGKLFLPLILSLALIESLVLLAIFVVASVLAGK